MEEVIYDTVVFDDIIVEDEYVIVKGWANRFKTVEGDVVIDDWGTTFSPLSYNIEDYKLNPVILYMHNINMPIGRAIKLEVSSDGLYLEAKIFKNIDENVYAAVRSGALSAFSIGIDIKADEYSELLEAYVVTSGVLVEISVVTIPSNTKSVVENIDLCSAGVCTVLRSKKPKEINLDSTIIKRMVLDILNN